MTDANETISLLDGPLRIDEESLAEAAEERGVLADLSAELKMWARENQLRLLLVHAERALASDGHALATTTFRLAGAPHPSCVFTWASLTVNLNRTPGATCLEVQPAREDAMRIKITEGLEPAVGGTISGINLEASLGAKREIEYEITRPQLVGVNFETKAIWTFNSPTRESDLRFDHDLSLKARFPADSLPGLRASIVLRARVAFRNFVGSIPLIGSQEADEKLAAYLDRAAQ